MCNTLRLSLFLTCAYVRAHTFSQISHTMHTLFQNQDTRSQLSNELSALTGQAVLERKLLAFHIMSHKEEEEIATQGSEMSLHANNDTMGPVEKI